MSPAVRLRRSDPCRPGLTRRRSGRGFVYLDAAGDRVTDPETLARIRELVIPPAWRDVWICADPRGHIQAVGTDAAGRRQYRYHDRWRELRDREKFARMLEFGATLPRLRRAINRDLTAGDDLSRARVLGAAARLLDVGLFRIGSREGEEDTGLGLATVRREHVCIRGGAACFDYPAKSGVRRVIEIEDPLSLPVVAALRRRRSGPEELLACRNGRQGWCHLHADDVNEYIKAAMGDRFSAKDFRTWNATVLAAMALAGHHARAAEMVRRPSGKRVMAAVAKEVSVALGNTPTVARASYIDPRVFDLYAAGTVVPLARVPVPRPGRPLAERVRRRAELAVLELLGD